ncbi:hypothetical protein FOXYSP1_16646 [Fusarium oxysporum f. sp. phaseoli]
MGQGEPNLARSFVRILRGHPQSQNRRSVLQNDRHMCCRLGSKPDGVSPIQEPGPFVHTHSPMKAEIGRFFVLDVCPPILLQTMRASSSLWQSRVYLTAEAWPGTKAAAAANLGRYEPTHGQICPP